MKIRVRGVADDSRNRTSERVARHQRDWQVAYICVNNVLNTHSDGLPTRVFRG